MSAARMEKRLLELSEAYIETRDPALREEYRRLHAEWKRAKGLA
jgi:hypothetical protein